MTRKRVTPTLRDIARVANVSHQTISLAINGSSEVSVETRERLLKLAREMGYRPNFAAKTLVTKRSYTIAVISVDVGFAYFRPLEIMALTAKDAGYGMFVTATDEAELEKVLHDAADRFVDGIVLIAPLLKTTMESLRDMSHGIPIVEMAGERGPDIPSIVYDQLHGARLATKHLIALGHHQIAMLCGDPNNFDSAGRYEGWLSTLKEHRLEPGPSVITTQNVDGGYQGMSQLLDEGVPFSALFTVNDEVAQGALHVLRERGYRVPQDVSVVGFDDLPEASYFAPPLTTLKQDYTYLGRETVRYLLGMIEKPGQPWRQRVLLPELIIRESTTRKS